MFLQDSKQRSSHFARHSRAAPLPFCRLLRSLCSHKTAYGVEFTEEIRSLGAVETHTQKWPVVPYAVAVTNVSEKANFALLYVDGQKVRGPVPLLFSDASMVSAFPERLSHHALRGAEEEHT